MNVTEEKLEFLTTCADPETFVIVSHFPNEKYERQRIAVAVIVCILFFTTISLNGISIVTIRKSSQLRSKVCYFPILLQSIVDLGVGILGIPLSIYYLISPFVPTANCALIILAVRITLLTGGLSIITLSAMTLERYIGVLHPYYYKSGVTKKRILIYVCASSLFYCLAFSYRTLIRIVLTAMIFVFLIFAAFVYTRIYLVIRRLVRSERGPRCESHGIQNPTNRQTIREGKHAKSCFLVVITFVLLLAPATLAPVFYTHGTIDFIAYTNWTFTLILLNSSINSLIFFWTKTLLRNEAIKILKTLFFQHTQ